MYNLLLFHIDILCEGSISPIDAAHVCWRRSTAFCLWILHALNFQRIITYFVETNSYTQVTTKKPVRILGNRNVMKEPLSENFCNNSTALNELNYSKWVLNQ